MIQAGVRMIRAPPFNCLENKTPRKAKSPPRRAGLKFVGAVDLANPLSQKSDLWSSENLVFANGQVCADFRLPSSGLRVNPKGAFMPELPHSEAPAPAPIRAAGTRRINLDMRARLDQADSFKGFPRGTAKPFELLTAFEQAEPYLGLPPHAYKLIGWLVRQTRPQDWEEGSRPIAWPSARRQQEFLGLSPQRVKMLNRALWEAGIFVMRDDPQGRRYGRRDAQGRTIEAYGFDLSPLAQRRDEFIRVAAAAKIERDRMRKLRRRGTLARRAIYQAVEELGAQGLDNPALGQLVRETAELVTAARACARSDELALAVKALESRRSAAEQLLRELIKPVETNPMGQVDEPHSTTTTLTENDINHTVIATDKCSQAEAAPPKDPCPSKSNRLFPESLQITPAQLVELAPRLAPYMPARFNDMSWPALAEAGLWLSGEMDINRTLWAHACAIMGREYAAVAVAIVSARPAGHFTSGPAGYFAGMVKKFEKGELCLGRTLWKLKDQAWGKDRQRKDSYRCGRSGSDSTGRG
jgi:replication initiation protein RepC